MLLPCWWRNNKTRPSLVAKGKLFCMLQDVPALSPVPSIPTGAEEALGGWHCPDWAERTLQHLMFHLPLFRAWQDVLWIYQLVLREFIEGSSWQQEFEVPPYPGSALSSPAGSGCRQWKRLGEEERAAGSLGGKTCLNLSVQEESSAVRDPSWSGCSLSGPPDSHLPEKTSDSCINQISVASYLLVLGVVYIESLIHTCGLIFARRFIITMVGSPNVTSCILNMLGMHIFICFNRNFALVFNSSNVHGQHREYLHVIIGCWCYCSAQEFWGMWSLCLALASHKVSVLWISISESVRSLRLWVGFFFFLL